MGDPDVIDIMDAAKEGTGGVVVGEKDTCSQQFSAWISHQKYTTSYPPKKSKKPNYKLISRNGRITTMLVGDGSNFLLPQAQTCGFIL